MGQYLSSISESEEPSHSPTDYAIGIYYASIGDLPQVVQYVKASSPFHMAIAAIDNDHTDILSYLLDSHIEENLQYELLGYATTTSRTKSILCMINRGLDVDQMVIL